VAVPHERLLREVRDPVYLLDGEGRVVFHNGRLPPGVEPSDAGLFNERVPEPLRVPLPLPAGGVSTERIRYRDALHHAHVVRRRLPGRVGSFHAVQTNTGMAAMNMPTAVSPGGFDLMGFGGNP